MRQFWQVAPAHVDRSPRPGTVLCRLEQLSAAVLAQVRAGILGAGFHEAKTVSPCNRASNAAHDLDAIVESAQAFLSRTLAAPLLHGGRRRFFAYVALTLMHEPLAWLHLRDRSRKRINPALDEALMRPNLTRYERHYVTGIAWVDASIGALLDTLHRLRVAQTTLTIFTADHGRDGKYTCTAAGMRVPWIASWPQALPAGSVLTDELVSHIDLLPTILAATSTPAAVGVSELKGSSAYTEGHERADGRSVLPALMRTKHEIEQQERQRYERRRERAYVLCETYRDRAILSQTHHIVWRSPDATRTGWGAASSAAAGIPRDGRDAWMPGSWRDAVQLYNHSTARSGSSPHRSATDDEGGALTRTHSSVTICSLAATWRRLRRSCSPRTRTSRGSGDDFGRGGRARWGAAAFDLYYERFQSTTSVLLRVGWRCTRALHTAPRARCVIAVRSCSRMVVPSARTFWRGPPTNYCHTHTQTTPPPVLRRAASVMQFQICDRCNRFSGVHLPAHQVPRNKKQCPPLLVTWKAARPPHRASARSTRTGSRSSSTNGAVTRLCQTLTRCEHCDGLPQCAGPRHRCALMPL